MVVNITYKCPQCNAILCESEDSLLCKNCHSEWEIRDNIPCFIKEETYWSDLPKEKMIELLNKGQMIGGRDGLKQCLRETKIELFEHTYDVTRSDWRFLLPFHEEGVVLDAGCGLGALSFPLSIESQLVVALDSTFERVKFIEIRKQQEGVTNIQPVLANILNLPFPDNYFDIVVLNAVLEWVGLTNSKIDPRHIQMKVLRDVQRVLKKNGTLYLATKNRFAYFYFLGAPDPHTGLRFITLLPRKIASLYSRLRRGKDYREYLYSLSGYKSLLREVGFSSIQVYSSFPSFRNFTQMLSIDDRAVMQYYLKNLFEPRYSIVNLTWGLLKILSLYSLVKYFVPDFSLIANKE